MDRKMFKAENNSVLPAIGEVRGSFSRVAKLPSSVLSVIRPSYDKGIKPCSERDAHL